MSHTYILSKGAGHYHGSCIAQANQHAQRKFPHKHNNNTYYILSIWCILYSAIQTRVLAKETHWNWTYDAYYTRGVNTTTHTKQNEYVEYAQ